MSRNSAQKTSKGKGSESRKRTKLDKSTSVITVRIDEDLNEDIEKHREDLGISKADFIRKYLDMSRYISIQNGNIKSLDESDLIIIKKGYLRRLIETMVEEEQMEFGIKIAKYINNISSLENKSEDLLYKLDLCEHLGFFKKKSDKENYILFSKKFGPKKFIEAFVYKLVNYQKKFVFDKRFTEETVKTQNKVRTAYEKTIQPLIEKSSTHYAFEFAKIEK